MAKRPAHPEARRAARARAWYRQGIVWIGAAVFAASLAGCIWMIVVAGIHDDPPLPVSGPQVLKVPVARPAAPADGQP